MTPISVRGASITGVSAAVPRTAVANDARVAQATGVLARRILATGNDALGLCLAAAEALLEETGDARSDFGAVIAVSFTQAQQMPCNACRAQARLGLANGIAAFDVLQACAGYGYGLFLAESFAAATGKKVLLLDGDAQSPFLAPGDAATTPLLADGGTATIVTPTDADAQPDLFAFATYGDKGDALRLPRGGTIAMDGFGVFRFVSGEVVRFLTGFLSECRVAPDALDAFVPHQANAYIVRQLAKSVGFAPEQLRVSADRFGNLSSASVPTTMAAHAVTGRILFAGFGGGLSASAGILNIPTTCRHLLIETDGHSTGDNT